MSLSETTARKDYVGNGSVDAFAYTWRIIDKSHLEVLVDGVVQVLDTDYTVSGVDAAAGGSVTFTTAPASGTVVTILRKQPLSQLSDYVLNEGHPSDRIEKDLDKVVMALQQDRETLGRALKFGKASLHKDQDIPDPGGTSQLLGFDGASNPVLFALSSLSVTGVENPMSAVADLIVGGAAGVPARLAKGAEGALLTVLDGALTWNGPVAALGQSLTEHLVVENLAARPARHGRHHGGSPLGRGRGPDGRPRGGRGRHERGGRARHGRGGVRYVVRDLRDHRRHRRRGGGPPLDELHRPDAAVRLHPEAARLGGPQ